MPQFTIPLVLTIKARTETGATEIALGAVDHLLETFNDNGSIVHGRIPDSRTRIAKLESVLRDLILGAEAMDKRLLALTGSPFEGKRGDIERAKNTLASNV